jgi:hypothetical protein
MQVVVEPRAVSTKEGFLKKRQQSWICLDGRITACPEMIKSRPFWNADHHYGVDRLATPCTAKQVLCELEKPKNILRSFVKAGSLKANIAVNDCDFDVCLSLWLLKNHGLVAKGKLSRSMRNLVDLQDRIDRRGGCLPIDPTSPLMKSMSWLNEPYERARGEGRLSKMGAAEMSELIQEIMGRIDRFAAGQGERRLVDGRYTKMALEGPGWVMVEEQGLYARGVMLRDGIRAFISVKPKDRDCWSYALWRMNRASSFNVSYLYRVFNAAEGLTDFSENCWGGSQVGGGSPRMTGSFLSPEQLALITNSYLEFAREHGFNETSLADFIEKHLPVLLQQPPKAA